MRLRIVTPDGGAFESECSYVNLPTEDGSVGVLSNHAPMLCALSEGILKLRVADNSTVTKKIGKGIAHIVNNEVTVLVDMVEN